MAESSLLQHCDGVNGESFFGIKMGMTLADIKPFCKQEPEQSEDDPEIYFVQPVHTNEIFDDVAVGFNGETCDMIIGGSEIYATDKNGSEVLEMAKDLFELLDLTYGEGTELSKDDWEHSDEGQISEFYWEIQQSDGKHVMCISLETFVGEEIEDEPGKFESWFDLTFFLTSKEEVEDAGKK